MTISQPLRTATNGIPGASTMTKRQRGWIDDTSTRTLVDGNDSDKKVCTESPTSPTGKHVTFNSWTDVVHIEHYRDLSKEEYEERWFSKREFVAIKSNLKRCIRLIERCDGIIEGNNYPEGFCSRGIETRVMVRRRRENHNEAVGSVLNEQYLQRAEGGSLPELVAMLYSVFSFPCQQAAHSIAVRDALEVGRTTPESNQPSDNESSSSSSLLDSGMSYPSEGVLQRLAGQGRLVDGATTDDVNMASIEEWLVERFEKAERLVKVTRLNGQHQRQQQRQSRAANNPAVDVE